MTDQSNNMNMRTFPGFPEVPPDAFADLPMFSPSRLRRTYKSHCPICLIRTETYNPDDGDVTCVQCVTRKLQQIRRNLLVYRRYKKRKNNELVRKWFLTNKLSGKFLTHRIMTYL